MGGYLWQPIFLWWMQLLYMAARGLRVLNRLNKGFPSAKHVLAAHHETPPQNPLHPIFMPVSFHDGLSGKVRGGEKRECAPSAIVASTLWWIWFPLFRWKMKVLRMRGAEEYVMGCAEIFSRRALIKKGEKEIRWFKKIPRG